MQTLSIGNFTNILKNLKRLVSGSTTSFVVFDVLMGHPPAHRYTDAVLWHSLFYQTEAGVPVAKCASRITSPHLTGCPRVQGLPPCGPRICQ